MRKMANTGLALIVVISIAVAEQVQARTYLGVATVPTNTEVGDHLKLAEGVGLTVVQVDPDSAAGEVMQTRDIIVKMDEQILIDPRQLAVLVRSHEPGEKVKFEIYRQGEKVVEEVELGEAEELPQMQPRSYPAPSPFGPPAQQFPPIPRRNMGRGGNGFMEEFQRDLEDRFRSFRESFGDMDEMLERLRDQMDTSDPQGPQVQTQQHSTVDITQIINGKRYHYTRKDNDQHLEVIEADGKVVFDGPINTEEELEKVPQDALDFLDSIDIDVDYEPKKETELIPSNAI